MVTKIGSILLLFFSLTVMAQDTTIAMRITDMQGSPIGNATVGVPFLLETTINGKVSAQAPVIKGLKKLHIEHQGVSTISSIINGVQSEKKMYRYVVRADKEGSIIIGPARIVVDNATISSSALTIHVGKEMQTNNLDEAYLHINADKQQVIIGEEIEIVIRFYYNKSVSFLGISEPVFTTFAKQPLKGPFSGSEQYKGRDVPYLEWRTTIMPEKEGVFTIPSIYALYRVENNRRTMQGFDMIAAFFNSAQQKSVHSNALTIKVDSLPEYKGTVHGVGTFDSLKAFIDQSSARLGEGIVFRLELEGTGNMQSIQSPALVMPETFTYYDSKSIVEEKKVKAGSRKKIFEYIVQARKPGMWVIPEQSFTYFDPTGKSYVTLTSNPVEVTIVEEKNNATDSKKDIVIQKSDATILSTNIPLHQRSWQKIVERQIPLDIFLWLLLVPLMVIGGYYCCVYIGSRKKIIKKYAFICAGKYIRNECQQGSCAQLYDIFVRLFAQLFDVPTTDITVDFMNSALQNAGSPQLSEEWNIFFTKIMACRFSSNIHHKQHCKELCNESSKWLKRLEKVL